jgi:hypothetical protein
VNINSFESQFVIATLKKSVTNCQIPSELIQTGGIILWSEIHKIIKSNSFYLESGRISRLEEEVYYSELLGFWTLFIAWNSKY